MVRDRIIPQFPIRIASAASSIDSEDMHENETASKYDQKSTDEEKTRVDSMEAASKNHRFITNLSSSTEKSNLCAKRVSLPDSRYLLPKVSVDAMNYQGPFNLFKNPVIFCQK